MEQQGGCRTRILLVAVVDDALADVLVDVRTIVMRNHLVKRTHDQPSNEMLMRSQGSSDCHVYGARLTRYT